MSRMSELSLEIQERLASGQSAPEVAKALNIPAHWVTEIRDEDEYIEAMNARINWAADDAYAAEVYAEIDAIHYGTR